MRTVRLALLFACMLALASARAANPAPKTLIRVGAVQAKKRLIDFRAKPDVALAAFVKLRRDYKESWIDRAAQERLAKLQKPASP